VPPHRNHRATVQHDVVAGRVFVRVICCPLEHRAVDDSSASTVAAGDDCFLKATDHRHDAYEDRPTYLSRMRENAA